MYMMTPTGGVMLPSPTRITISTPKWTSSMPRVRTMGTRIGVSSSTMTVLSTNIPAITRKPRRRNSTITGFSESPAMNAAMSCGTCSTMIAKPSMAESMRISMIMPMSVTARPSTPGRSETFSSRWAKKPTRRA